MPQDNNQKIKLVKIMEILHQETDEDHPMRCADLCDRLNEIGISSNKQTLGRDIRALNDYGYEVMTKMVGHDKAFYISDRSFSVPELKILIDAVQAASFVTDKKTAELIDKLAALGGSHKASILKSNIVKFNTRKHSNETVYYNVGFLEEAIQQKKQVSFRYFDLDENRQRVYRKGGDVYITEPVALVFNEDNYYLIAYSAKHENTTNYRVDRIDSVEILDVPISEEARKRKNKIARYTKSAFKMFDGQQEKVTLRFDDKLMGAVYDKFGEDTKMKRILEHTIETTVQVRIAPTFWGWIFQFGTDMEIAAPEDLTQEYKKRTADLLGR